jgi:hypothetical protein
MQCSHRSSSSSGSVQEIHPNKVIKNDKHQKMQQAKEKKEQQQKPKKEASDANRDAEDRELFGWTWSSSPEPSHPRATSTQVNPRARAFEERIRNVMRPMGTADKEKKLKQVAERLTGQEDAAGFTADTFQLMLERLRKEISVDQHGSSLLWRDGSLGGTGSTGT